MAILQNLEQTVTLLIILSILVVAHEWGHFIVARLCGIRVDDFSIGFGKRLFRIGKRGDTEYNVRMLPLGGFVKIAGMEPDEAPITAVKDKLTAKSDPDAADIPLLAENTAEDRSYTAPDGFYSKPLWQRSLVILAGPVMSFVLGYVVFCLMGLTTGVPTGKVLTRISQVQPGGEGHRVGLRAGDVITAINGQPVTDGKDMVARINQSLGKTLVLSVRRGRETLTKTVTPQPAMKNDKPVLYTDVIQPGSFGQTIGLASGDTVRGINAEPVTDSTQALQVLRQNAGKSVDLVVTRPSLEDPLTLHAAVPVQIGAGTLPVLNSHPFGVLKIDPSAQLERLGLVQSIRAGNLVMASLFQHLGEMVQRPSQLKNNAGGIIYMYQATGVAAKNGLVDQLSLLASLSISLAVFNLLPIPVLDGGHLLTFFIEWVRRGKRLTDQQQQAFLMTGLAIIGVLFVLIMSNDIIRTITHQVPQ